MCLLTFIKQGGYINLEDLRNGADYNPDGFGFAVHAGSSIITGHGMEFESVLERFVQVREQHDGHALFHSRITTHGNTDISNCHPFRVGNDQLTVLGHNGVLPIKVDKADKRSDTNIFANEYLPNLGGVYALDDLTVRAKLEKWATGSKLVVLTADRHANEQFYILNESSGHWVGDVWWSNRSYDYQPTPSYSKYSSYSKYGYTGWSMGVSSDDRVLTPRDNYSWDEVDESECRYGEIYEVECPMCSHTEVHDLMESDAIDCENCGNCMWCGHLSNFCKCYADDIGDTMYEPVYRKMSDKEVATWANTVTNSNKGQEQFDVYQM